MDRRSWFSSPCYLFGLVGECEKERSDSEMQPHNFISQPYAHNQQETNSKINCAHDNQFPFCMVPIDFDLSISAAKQ